MFENLVGASPILLPIVALVVWTLIQQAWMVVTRLPAMNAAGLGPQSAERTSELGDKLPKHVQWKADNYNHLMEQPTIFYAVGLALAIAGLGSGLSLWCAWIYTVSRVIHSIVHSTVNIVNYRFLLFATGTLALLVMSVNGMIQLMG